MPAYFIRSTIFNLCFYVLTGIACILLLPTLILPRKIYLAVVYGFVRTTAFLEKYILGLTYEIRGKEHLPRDGAYIIAAKHQSAYETFKLHILFKDPAIVLKKELLKIPLWGEYLRKSDVIAIDRSSPKVAIKSIQDGAKRVAAQNRPILIFPQGTRVPADTTAQEKPYKIGIIRIQEATNLPIIPMALNTGYFYPKHKWCKKPGKVVFEFLKPIPPGKKPSDALNIIEMKTEEVSAKLLDEARSNSPKRKTLRNLLIGLCTGIICAWTANWFIAAHLVQTSVQNFQDDLKSYPIITKSNLTPPNVSGFPFTIKLSFPIQELETASENITIEKITAESLPFMGMPIDINARNISAKMPHWEKPIHIESLTAEVKHTNDILSIIRSETKIEETSIAVNGTANFTHQYPKIDFNIDITNFEPLLAICVQNNIVKEQHALFAGVALKAMEKDGIIHTTLTSDQNKVYLGPMKVMELR